MRSGLKDATLDALRWVSIARGLAEVVVFGAGVALAHLVTPAEFGRLAVAVIVNELSESLAAESLGNALVQRSTLGRRHLQAGMFIGLVSGFALMVLTIVLAPLIVGPLFGAQTTALFQLFAPLFLLAGVRVVPLATLQRRLDFRTAGKIELGGVTVSALTAVGLASVLGLQAKSYVFGELASGVLMLALLLAVARPPLPRARMKEMRELLAFGLPAGFSGLSWVIQRNIDYAILGARLPAAGVGYYYRAFTVSVEGERRISGIVSRLALPVYSRIRELHDMRAVRARIVRANATVVIPLLALFIVIAPRLVPWLFGEHWQPAVLPAQILAGAGIAMTVNGANSALLLAANRQRELSLFNLCQLVAYAATVLLCSSRGLIAVCIGVVAFQLVVTFAYMFLLNRLVDMPRGQLLHDLKAAVISSSVLLAVSLLASSLMGRTGASTPLYLVVVGAAGLCAYAAAVRVLFPRAWSDLALIAGRLAPKARRAGRATAAQTLGATEHPDILPSQDPSGDAIESKPWPIRQSA